MRMRFVRVSIFTFLLSLIGSAAAVGCQNDDPDRSLGSAGSAGRGGTGKAGSGSIVLPDGGGGEGARGPDACGELVGLEQCGGTKKEAQLNTINVLLVIDKSGSMTDQPTGFATDKWSALKSALGSMLSTVNERVHLGLLLYPYSTDRPIDVADCGTDCCSVPSSEAAVLVNVAPASESAPAINTRLAATSPGGGTPTALALARAYEYFDAGAGAALEGSRYVLLATDGGPNCNSSLSCDEDRCTPNLDGDCNGANCCENAGEYCVDDAAVTAEITRLNGAGIPTFVIGIPGTEDYRDYLDAFALAGGVPRTGGSRDYYAVSADQGVQGLVDVFSDITTELVRSCEIELTETPPSLMSVNVAVDCEVVSQANEPDGSGWEFDREPDPTKVILHGPVCENLQANGATRIDVVYGCPTIR
jgi:hypothetical protein